LQLVKIWHILRRLDKEQALKNSGGYPLGSRLNFSALAVFAMHPQFTAKLLTAAAYGAVCLLYFISLLAAP
jgi:hypothetical protein